jgi:hypothetical protein
VSKDSSTETSNSVSENSFRGQFAIAKRVEHGSVSAQESAPAHANSGEHGNSVTINPTMSQEVWHKAEGSTNGTKCGDWECDEVRVMETKQPLKHNVYFVG